MGAFFLDSSQSYNTGPTAVRRYTSGTLVSGGIVVPGGYGIVASALQKAFSDVASTHLYVGEAIIPGTGSTSLGQVLNQGTTQVSWWLLSNGALAVERGGTAGYIGESAPDLVRMGNDTTNTYYIEADIILHASAGQVKLYLNGNSTAVLSLTGISTLNPGAPVTTYNWDTVQRSGSGCTGAHYYVGDATVLVSGRLGPITVTRILMASNSAVQLTPNTSTNWQNVNDSLPPDDDATYNSSSTTGHTDLFVAQTISTGDTALAFQVGVQGRRTADGVAALKTAVKQGGTTYRGPEGFTGLTYYENSRQAYYATLPDGSTAITDAGLNGLRYGYEKSV